MISAEELRELTKFATEFVTLRKHIEQQVIEHALTGDTECIVNRLPVRAIAQLRLYMEVHGYSITASEADEQQSVDVVISWKEK